MPSLSTIYSEILDEQMGKIDQTITEYLADFDLTHEQIFTSYLTLLIHYATRNGLDFDARLQEARDCFKAEVAFLMKD